MSKENTAGIGVNNYYGQRDTTEGVTGCFKDFATRKPFVVEITGTNLSLVEGTIPASFKPIKVEVEVVEAFALGGTTPVIAIGTKSSETTNGFNISEAQAEAVGYYEITSFNGTWQAQLAADTALGAALGGTSPTITSAGRAKVTIYFGDQ